MKKPTWIIFFLFGCAGIQAQQPPPTPVEQTPPARIPGQAGSPEELATFNELSATQGRDERIRLGQAFLTTYPNSGLSSFVHYVLANAYGLTETQRYVTHAEMALLELPRSPALLATLAFIYAETGKTALGAERGRAALELLQGLENPPQMSETNWLLQKLEIAGQSNYAIGRHLLQEADPEVEGREEKLAESSEYLLRAMEQLPDDPYSAFRLAESYLQREQFEKALTYFARTAAVGGSVGQIAQTRLEQLYEAVHSGREGLDRLLQEQQAALERARAEREAMLSVFDKPQPPGSPPGARPPGR